MSQMITVRMSQDRVQRVNALVASRRELTALAEA